MRSEGRAAHQRVVLIIQARMGSTRLPGKSMMPLAGEPLIGRLLERVKGCQEVDQIVLAIPDTPENEVLAGVGLEWGVAVYSGSEGDLVDRYYQAAQKFSADVVVRLPGDNPVPEPGEIDRIIAHHLRGRAAFSTNITQLLGNGYPDGIGAEVFDFKSLEEVWRRQDDPLKREHLHLNFFDYATGQVVDSEQYPVATVSCPAGFSRPDLVLDVNTPAEYAYLKALYSALYPKNPQFHITDIIAWHDGIDGKVPL
ncbi:MAG: NTP transferase domain-containing protein [Magnetococcales bacterium]|nr:NTP transferase domain-containing protein [Magnetococcales bacterium]